MPKLVMFGVWLAVFTINMLVVFPRLEHDDHPRNGTRAVLLVLVWSLDFGVLGKGMKEFAALLSYRFPHMKIRRGRGTSL
ncbi:uncharacterized protein B0T23DRAFT_175501 [Neurospora hispaniola]|uniref:Uncharacterized protein n=1 Tax=Neurospora hispaniola TaxID=588809 RepID=A0AAJ0I6S7_9PEZI|nr:hypothetical protein B0T23DRAFT_175501 [Neurospora hispaniola]